jgi:hypothetical protein
MHTGTTRCGRDDSSFFAPRGFEGHAVVRHYQTIGAVKHRCWVDSSSLSKPDAMMAALREGLRRLEMLGDAGRPAASQVGKHGGARDRSCLR